MGQQVVDKSKEFDLEQLIAWYDSLLLFDLVASEVN